MDIRTSFLSNNLKSTIRQQLGDRLYTNTASQGRGFCPSCGARRMAESAALLVDEVLPEQPMRQWALSFPFQLRLLFASRPKIMGRVPGECR